jgi:hypothetical protein
MPLPMDVPHTVRYRVRSLGVVNRRHSGRPAVRVGWKPKRAAADRPCDPASESILQPRREVDTGVVQPCLSGRKPASDYASEARWAGSRPQELAAAVGAELDGEPSLVVGAQLGGVIHSHPHRLLGHPIAANHARHSALKN